VKRAIHRTVRYAHPPERVWEALTTREALAAWLMPNDFSPEVGHRFNFRTDPAPGFDGIVRCEVLALEPPRRMVWSWAGGSVDTTVTFELRAVADGTELRFAQEGFEGLAPVLTSFILQAGFSKMYRELLPAVLDRLARGEPVDAGTCAKDAPGAGERIERGLAHVIARLTPRKRRDP